ncbi:hypothetical protein [Mycobacterium syngnathidarum]
MRYRLDVVASSVVDVVRNAGGCLVDQVMAGWEATVLLGGDDDVRPLQILGVDTADLDLTLQRWDQRARPQKMMVAGGLVFSHAGVREAVNDTVAGGLAEVMLWGSSGAEKLSGAIHSIDFELSAAARAFKTYALAGAGDNTAVDRTETFRRAEMPRSSRARSRSPLFDRG